MYEKEGFVMLDSSILLNAGQEFIKLFGELFVLFVGISFMVALLQLYISPARVQRLLSTPKRSVNSMLGASLGAITPFCSCSTIPMLTGLIRSEAPFCGVVSFLLASPVLNPAIITLFMAFFGLKATLVYGAFVFVLAVVMGLFLDKMGFVKEVKDSAQAGCCCGGTSWETLPGSFWDKQRQALTLAVRNSGGLLRHVLPYLLLGAGLGAFIHEVIPAGLLEGFIGADAFWAVPLAAVIGIPMYIRTETMIPVASILMAKGVAPGVVVALIIGGAGASLPEISLLSSMFTRKMIAAFLGCVFTVAIVTGCVFNWIM